MWSEHRTHARAEGGLERQLCWSLVSWCVLLLSSSPVVWRLAETSRVWGQELELDGGLPGFLHVSPGAVSLS